MGFPRTPFLSVAEKLPPCRQAQEHGITGGGWALVKKFPGKAVLSIAARGGLLHGGVHQTGKIIFQRRAGRGGRWAETLSLQRFMFIGTQCDLWGRPDGTGHEKISRGKFPRLIFSLIPSLFERHISIGCADLIWDITLGQYRTTATIRITGRPFCKNQLGRPCFCSQERTDSSCQAGSVSQNQIR